MKTIKELEAALQVAPAVSNIEKNWYTKEETQKFISQLEEKIKEQANLINDLSQIVFKNSNLIIYWDRLNDNAKVPNKRDEDAGFDIYTTDGECVLKPGETKFFGTGLRSAFPKEYWVEIKERGSTGAVGLSVRSGVIDSGYRGEWKIMLTNVNNYPVEFSNSVDKTTYVYSKLFKKKVKKVIYPLSKAIAQAVVIPLPKTSCRPWNEEEIESSVRGESGWGASGK